jgi:hypothetical protein
MNRIEDLEDIIRILVNMLERKNISKDTIKLELRIYHYCYDCMNHYRGCKCDETPDNLLYDESKSESYDDDYTSSADSNISNSDIV